MKTGTKVAYCFSIKATQREGIGGPCHIQGKNNWTLCGIPYREWWDFDYGVPINVCLRCANKITKLEGEIHDRQEQKRTDC